MTDGVPFALGLVGVAGVLLFASICKIANVMFRQHGLPADEESSDDL